MFELPILSKLKIKAAILTLEIYAIIPNAISNADNGHVKVVTVVY